MRYLLDTMVVSEAARPLPDAGVVRWLDERSVLDLYISTLLLGEIRKGVLQLPAGRKREGLETWLRTALVRQFAGRVLPVDEVVALAWAGLAVEARAKRRELPLVGGLLLATAAVHDLVLVTRNERDCGGWGVDILNPWSPRLP